VNILPVVCVLPAAQLKHLLQTLSQPVVMSLHVPLMIPTVQQKIREVASVNEEVLWIDGARQITFAAATRALVGDLFSDEVLQRLFPCFQEMGDGMFALVCFAFTSCRQALHACRARQYDHLSICLHSMCFHSTSHRVQEPNIAQASRNNHLQPGTCVLNTVP
jgi:hypothetical protein